MVKVRTAVFDLDGTLVDSRRDLADATNALILELGGTPLDVDSVAAMVGEGATLLVRRALTASGLDADTPGALGRFLELYDERLSVHTKAYPGMVETLTRLKSEMRLSVLTNKPSRATTRLLAELELDEFFDGVVGGDTPLGRKPDPAGLLHLVRSAGATPESAVLIGDSHIDVETARRARTRICVVSYGFGYRTARGHLRGDEWIADSPKQILTALSAT